jgi:hypothetical protein
MKLKIPKIPKITMFGIDIVKNMLFFALFIFVFLFLLGVIVAPSIKKFKSTKTEYIQTKFKLDTSNQKLATTTKEYQKLFKENRKIIFALKREFDKDNFKRFAKPYMQILDIKDKNISVYENKFIKKTYIVTAKLSTPVNFYKFVDASKNYKNILKIYFPIVFKAKNGELNLLFKLEHFKTK